MVNKPLIRPFFWGGVRNGGGRFTSHDCILIVLVPVLFFWLKLISKTLDMASSPFFWEGSSISQEKRK